MQFELKFNMIYCMALDDGYIGMWDDIIQCITNISCSEYDCYKYDTQWYRNTIFRGGCNPTTRRFNFGYVADINLIYISTKGICLTMNASIPRNCAMYQILLNCACIESKLHETSFLQFWEIQYSNTSLIQRADPMQIKIIVFVYSITYQPVYNYFFPAVGNASGYYSWLWESYINSLLSEGKFKHYQALHL